MEGNLVAVFQGLPDQLSIVLTGAGTCNLGGRGSTVIIKGITQSSFAQTPAQIYSAASQPTHSSPYRVSLPPAYSSLFPSYSADYRRSSRFRHLSKESATFIKSLRDYSHPASSSRPPSDEVLPGVQSGGFRRRAHQIHRTLNMYNIGLPRTSRDPDYSAASVNSSGLHKRNYVMRNLGGPQKPRLNAIDKRRRRRQRSGSLPPKRVLPLQESTKRQTPLTRHGRETGRLMRRISGNPTSGRFGNITQELKTWFTRQSNYDERPPHAPPKTRHRFISPGSTNLPHNRPRRVEKVSTASIVNARLRVGGKRIRYCPKSGNRAANGRDQPPWSQLSRAPDVLYIHEITRCIRDTLRTVCDDCTCPNFQERYRQHALCCPERVRQDDMSTRTLQSFTPIDLSAPEIRLEDVECTSDGLVIDQEVVCPPCQLKPCGCRKTVPCKRWDHQLIINDRTLIVAVQKLDLLELKERLFDWFNETQIFDEYTFTSKGDKQERAAALAEILTNIAGEEKNFKTKAYGEIKEFINKLPIKFPGSIGQLEKCKHEAIEELFKDFVSSESLTRLKKEIDDWLIELPILKIRNNDYRRGLVNEIAAKLKPVIMNQPESRDEYINALFNEIGDVLLSLPLQVKGNVTKVLGHYSEELTIKLGDMSPDEAIKKCRVTTFGVQEEEAVLKWLQSLPVFAANTPTAICKNKAAVADLINILNTLQTKEKHNFRKTLTHHLRFWLRHFAIKQNNFLASDTTERYVRELVALFRLPDEEAMSFGLWLDTENVGEHISDWIPEIPEFAVNGVDEKRKAKVTKELQEILGNTENDENFLDNVKNAVENWFDKTDVSFSGTLNERNRRKSEVVQSFLDQITDASGMTGLEREVYEWAKSLPIKRHLGFDLEYFVKETANRLKPIITNHPEDKKEYYMLLEEEMEEIVDDVPLKIEGNRTTLVKKVKSDLLDRLKHLPSDEAILKVKAETFGLKEQKQIFSWLSRIPGFTNMDPQVVKDNQRLASELAKVLNPMKAKDSENFEENIREHFKYWLSHNLLNKNTHLDKKTVESYVEQLVRTLTSEPMQPKRHIRQQLQSEIKEILQQSRIPASRQEELEQSILDHLMNYIGHRESEIVTKDFVQQVFLKFNVLPSDAEDLTEEIMIHAKNIMRSMPTKRKHKNNLRRPVFNILEQEDVKVENQEQLQSSLTDLLADFKSRKTDDVTAENKLYERLIKEDLSESTCRDLASELLKQAREVPQYLPTKREVKESLSGPVNEIIDHSNIYVREIALFKGNIIDSLADYILGTKTNEEIRNKLLEDFRIANIKDEDAQGLIKLLIDLSKRGLSFIVPKRQVKQNLKNPVIELLDSVGIKISNREHFDNNVIDTLAAYKLGRIDERATRQTLLDIFGQANIADETAQNIINELFHHIKEIPTSTPPRIKVIQHLKNPINEVLRQTSHLNDRDDVRKNIIDILADYKQGKTDSKTTKSQLQTVLSGANVPKSLIKGLITDLMDNCKEIAYNLPSARVIRHFLNEYIEEVLEISGVAVNKELNKKISEALADYINGNMDDRTTKDKLFALFRVVDLPNSTIRDIVDEFVDQAKQYSRNILPKKNITKQILKGPVEYIFEQKDIYMKQPKVVEETVLETLVDCRHGSTEVGETADTIIKNLKMEGVDDRTAKELAKDLIEECNETTITAPTRTQIKQFLRNPITHILKSLGLTVDQQETILSDTIETLTEYKRGTLDQETTVKSIIDSLIGTTIPKEEYENVIADLMEKTDSLPLPLPQKRFIKHNLKSIVNNILKKTLISQSHQEEVADAITESLATYTQGKSAEISTKSKIVDVMKTQNIEDNQALKYADELLTSAQKQTHKMQSKKQLALKWKRNVANELANLEIYEDKFLTQLSDILANHSLGRVDDRTAKNKLLTCFRNFGVQDDTANRLISKFMAQADGTLHLTEKMDKSHIFSMLKPSVKEVIAELTLPRTKEENLVDTVTEHLEDYVMRQQDETETEKILYDSFCEAAVPENEALNYTQKCMNLTLNMSIIEKIDKTSQELEPIATSSPRGSQESESKFESTEQEGEYLDKIKKQTNLWLNKVVKGIPPKQAQELIDSITDDIVERKKYFQANPNLKIDEFDELTHYKKKAGLWKNKLKYFNIKESEAENVVTQVDHLLNAINKVPQPPMKRQHKFSKHEKKLAESLNKTTVQNAEEVFKKDVEQLTNDLSLSYLRDESRKNKIKDKMKKKLPDKIQELNKNPEIFKDLSKYNMEVEKEIDSVVKELPSHKELDREITLFKTKIADKTEKMKNTIKNERAGQEYKQNLRHKISVAFPPDANKDRESFEALKDNLADQFVNANFDAHNEELREQYKKAIREAINTFNDKYIQKFPDLPEIPKEKLNEYLYDVLKQVPLPQATVLEREVAEIKDKQVVKDWIKTLPLARPLEAEEKMEALRNISVLAKRLQNLTVQKHEGRLTEEEYNNRVEEEIEQFINKLPIQSGETIDPKEISQLLTVQLEEGIEKLNKISKDKSLGMSIDRCQCKARKDKIDFCCCNAYKKRASSARVCCNPRCQKRNVATNALPTCAEIQTDVEALTPQALVECPHFKSPPVIVNEHQLAKHKTSDRGINAMPSSCGSQTSDIPTCADTQTNYPRPYFCQIPSVPCRSHCGSYQKPFFENACPSFCAPPPFWSMPPQQSRCDNYAQCELNQQTNTEMTEHEISHCATGTDPEPAISPEEDREEYSNGHQPDQTEDTAVTDPQTRTQPAKSSSTRLDKSCKCQRNNTCKCRKATSRNYNERNLPCGNVRLPCPWITKQNENVNHFSNAPPGTTLFNNRPCFNDRQPDPYKIPNANNANEENAAENDTTKIPRSARPYNDDTRFSSTYKRQIPMPGQEYVSVNKTGTSMENDRSRFSNIQRPSSYMTPQKERTQKSTPYNYSCYQYPVLDDQDEPAQPNNTYSYRIEHTIPECPVRKHLQRMCEDVNRTCSNRSPWSNCGANRSCRGRYSCSPCRQRSRYRHTCQSWDYGCVRPCQFGGSRISRCNSPVSP